MVRCEYMEIRSSEVKSEPTWFTKWKRNMLKWIIKQMLRLIYFLIIILLIVIVFTFLITHLSWEKIFKFLLDSGHFVAERFFALFNTTQGA